MSDLPRPRGRGAALLEAVQRAKEAAAVLEAGGSQRPSGRGAKLAMLRAQQSGEIRPGLDPSTTSQEGEFHPRVGRGRAAMLQKLQALQIGGVAPITQMAPTPTPRVSSRVEEEEDEPTICKFTGESGAPVHLTANYINLSIDKDKGVFEYEVNFSIPLDSKAMRIKVLNSNLDKLGGIKSFDGGHCLYLPIRLLDIDTNINTVHPVDGSPMVMIVKYKKQKRMKECLHLFNTLFKRIMRTLLMFQFNRNYFDLKSAIFIPQYKLEVLPGFAVTCEEYQGGLMLCLDAQHRMLRTQTVYDLLIELKSIARDRYKEEAYKLILGSSVLTRYNTKNYIIDEIMWDGSPLDTFQTSTGQSITYIDYYKNQHNLIIKDHHQPLLLHKQKLKKGGPKDQGEERLVCLIPELCHLTGLTDQMRADFKVMQSVAQHTRLTPPQRMRALQVYMKRVNENADAKKILSDWGLSIDHGTIDLNGRILDPERIRFGNDTEITVGPKMDWGMDMSKNSVCQAVDLINWTIVHTAKDTNFANEFYRTMMRVGPPMGCRINEPYLCAIPNDRTATVVQQINTCIKSDLQCLVIICPTQRQDVYNAIKKICCVQHPVASQVILSRTLSKPQRLRAIVQKIALQINCKLGGTLWSLKIPAKRWMVVGIDTYHSPGQNFSWYGFVASLNDSFTRYYSTAVKQSGELGDNVKICFTKALVKYREVNGFYPTQVVVFRDGVGDGQLQVCKTHEVNQLEDCMQNMDIKAELCFVVVQKRINTRLFTKRHGDLENPRAGTVMDHTITKRYLFDYYLVSQHVGQGTVTPTHYICLHNSSNLKPDVIQKLSFKMCHLYYNWSGTVRVPAPCQYAHKLAYLVGQCIQASPDEKLSTRLYYL